MKKLLAVGVLASLWVGSRFAYAQDLLTVEKEVPYTVVKNQAMTGTCWSFSTTSLVESQATHSGQGEFDISEMFTVRNIYLEKARNYLLRQGTAQFGPGGLGHDVIHAIDQYGAVPESVYSGMLLGQKHHDHGKLDATLKVYLDSLLKSRPIPANWAEGYEAILDSHLGKAPERFLYGEKQYTPLSFAREVLHFDAGDYVYITSFSHHPFYKTFVVEIPDNWANVSYYNVPLNDMISLAETAIKKGFSLMWDADVSNAGFDQRNGYAMQFEKEKPKEIDPDAPEATYDQAVRQKLFEGLITQDDHLMHIVGLERSKGGKRFFLVKNSWGEVGPFKGMIHVSEAYLAINTITLVVPKAALTDQMKAKLGIR